MIDATDRPPPFNLEAEEAVVGSLLISGEEMETVVGLLAPEQFYSERHATTYRSMLRLYEQGLAVDFLTLSHELDRAGKLEAIGGIPFLAQLSAAVPTAVHAEYYAKIVADCALRRHLLTAASQMAKLVFDGQIGGREALVQAEALLLGLGEQLGAGDLRTVGALATGLREKVGYLREHTDEVTGIPSGIPDLDRITNGFQPGNLIIVAARPGAGKSTFALRLALHAAQQASLPVAIFSLEMAGEELIQRVVAAEANVDSFRLRTGYLEAGDWERICRSERDLQAVPLLFDDASTLTVAEWRSKVKRLYRDEGVRLVIVDYLQLLHGSDRENRVQEVAEISRTLKAVARDLKVPVIALSQLNRAVEHRPGKRPQLSDLRESGSIEQDADLVLFLHRDDAYRGPEEPRDNLVDVQLAKHRNGRVGSFSLYFDLPKQTFRSLVADADASQYADQFQSNASF